MTRLGTEPTGVYLSIAREAGERWQARAKALDAAKRNIARRAWTKLDTPARLVERAERLGRRIAAVLDRGDVSTEEALAFALAAGAEDSELPAPERVEQARAEAIELRNKPDRLSSMTFERIIGGSRDLLSIEFFEQGLDAARSVGLVSTDGIENGTGFLVAPGVMITNWHVLQDVQMAARSDLMLDFEANRYGPNKAVQKFRLLPDRFFLTKPELDYALVAVEGTSNNGKNLEDYGYHPLIGKIGKAVVGECVNVVQHPGGKVKQIAIRNNRLLDLPGESDGEKLDPYFIYEADTEKGSSGSPVFNDQWEVVALHHAAVPKMKDGQLIDAKGNVIDEEDDDSRIVWIANEGIRVSRLVADVVGAADRIPEDMRAIWRETVETWQAGDLGEGHAPDAERRRPNRPESLPARDRPAIESVNPAVVAGDGMFRRRLVTSGSRIDIMLPLRFTVEFGAPEAAREYRPDPNTR